MLEILISALSANGCSFEDFTASTRNDGLKNQDFAACMTGLSNLHVSFIYAKYMLDDLSNTKGIGQYRLHLYKKQVFKDWIFNLAEKGDVTSERYFSIVSERTSHSPILINLAWEQSMFAQRCLTCKGVGQMGDLKCEDCQGKTYLNAGLSADRKAIQLGVSRAQYFAKWHKPFIEYYQKPLWIIEAEAIASMAENWG